MSPSSTPDLDAGHKSPLTLTATAVILCLSACKLLVHLYAGRHYGYFVDELYYLACSRHLDWGYVDQPPLIALITWIVRSLVGDALPAIRFLPALAGAGEVALTALIARELGGKRFAQGLAALATLVAPGILAGDNLSVHECIRAVVLDGLRLVADTHSENRQSKTLDLVRHTGRLRPRKQILHADLRSWHLFRLALDFAAPCACQSLALDGRRYRLSHLPAESALERPPSLPVPRVTGQYPPQRARCPSYATEILRSGDSDHAA